MSKILGLDLGTNSIGWAVVDKENEEILGSGVRIFPAGKDNIGQGDKEESRNAVRRDKRQTRRGYFRRRLRKIKLLEKLIELDMCPLSQEELLKWKNYDKNKGASGRKFPDSPQFIEWLKINPYNVRAKALKEDISLHELGRIFYHIIQRRGFLSNRKDKDSGKIFEGKEGMKGINETKKELKENNTTLGAYLNSIYPSENHSYHKSTDDEDRELRIRARYTLREMYIDEINQIWNKQAMHLGLDDKTHILKKQRFLDSSDGQNRRKKKVDYLIQAYGKENVTVKGDEIITTREVPLKEYFIGQINELEDGSIDAKSNESLLFYQRPLRSQKSLISKCTFEGKKYFDKKNNRWIEAGTTPAPVSHPEYEEFRAWQLINNIEYGTRQNLDHEQKESVMELFNSKKSAFKFAEIPKKLNLTFERFNYDDAFQIPHNNTIANLRPLFPEDVWAANANDIWHLFYFMEDNDKLFEKLKRFNIKINDSQKLEKIKLKDAYSNVSLKAIRNILPFLKKGYKYHLAVILGGVCNAFKTTIDGGQLLDRWELFKDNHEEIERDIKNIVNKKNKEGETLEKIQEYLLNNEFGFVENDRAFKKLYHHSQIAADKQLKEKVGEVENLRNPIVQQALGETRRLVNQLIQEYGMFDRINVELGRDVKAGKDARNKMSSNIQDNETKNQQARETIIEAGLRPSRDNIQKFLLFKEIEGKNGIVVCPYTGKTMGIGDVLGQNNQFQIEHIFPRSTSIDDSFANKTLCESKFNALKGNLTPYLFYQKNPDPNLWGVNSWEAVKKRAFALLPYSKAKKFTSEQKEIKLDDFISSQLNDSRYIAVKTKDMLADVCSDVRVLTGKLTSELRHLWGLNNVLQPVQNLNFNIDRLDENKRVPHYLVLNKDNQVENMIPVRNNKPEVAGNEITIPGEIAKNKFSSKFLNNNEVNVNEDLSDGKYWIKLRLHSEPDMVQSVFTDVPELTDQEIMIRGKVIKNQFSNENLGRINTVNMDDGDYRGVFKVKNVDFIKPEKKKQPAKKKGQLLLYGHVKDNLFNSYIYECETNEPDGNYWALIDLDVENGEYHKIKNDEPVIDNRQLLIEGTVNKEGHFSTYIDSQFDFKTDFKPGKYWFVFTGDFNDASFFPSENKVKIDKDQKLVEGNVWVDKYTGELKFDPKKNRDDHRHHAIDALAIAVSEQSFVQKLSTYYANMDEKVRGRKYEEICFPAPWKNFRNDAEKVASGILVSHKINWKERQVLTDIRKKISKNGKQILSEGKEARGQLHKENTYGLRKSPQANESSYHIRKNVGSLTDPQLKKIVDPIVKEIVINSKKEEKEIKKELEYLRKQLNKVNDAEADHVQKKIDDLQKRQKLLFTLPNKKGGDPIPIKKVRIKEVIDNAKQVSGRNIKKLKSNTETPLNQYVNPRNNHHVALYKDKNGVLFEEIVTFWEAANRKKEGKPIIQKDLGDGSTFITSLQENDMFIIGLPASQIDWDHLDYRLINKHLFRVQKISSYDYFFRHHLASSIQNDDEMVRISSMKRWNDVNPIKVSIDSLGNILKYN